MAAPQSEQLVEQPDVPSASSAVKLHSGKASEYPKDSSLGTNANDGRTPAPQSSRRVRFRRELPGGPLDIIVVLWDCNGARFSKTFKKAKIFRTQWNGSPSQWVGRLTLCETNGEILEDVVNDQYAKDPAVVKNAQFPATVPPAPLTSPIVASPENFSEFCQNADESHASLPVSLARIRQGCIVPVLEWEPYYYEHP